MKYVGSKERHAKEIIPIILEGRTEGQLYVEPFIGGASIISKVKGNRIGADAHPFIVELWKAVRDGWIPPTSVSEEEYRQAKETKELNALTAFIGFGCSYSGKWFGGYARGNDAKGQPRNYADESCRAVLKKAKGLEGCDLRNCTYSDLDIPENSIIYCDPPYAGTTKYSTGNFNSEEFWEWANSKVQQGHKVFVSEYTAPTDWECVWSKQVNNTLAKHTGSKQGVEKLFTKKKLTGGHC